MRGFLNKPLRHRLGFILVSGLAAVGVAASIGWAHHATQHPRLDDIAMSVSEMFDLYECARCHRLATPHRLIGPSLWKLGERMDAATIRASILQPDAAVQPGYPAGLMQKRLQTVGFYADIERAPAILDRIVAHLAGTPKLGSKAARIAPAPDQSADAMRSVSAGAVVWPDGQQFEVLAFRIDDRLVTKAEFAVFMTNGGYSTKRYWDRIGWSVFIRRRDRSQPLGWLPERDMKSEQPVVGLSWYEADAYCRWVGKALPSVLEWERACQEVPAWLRQPPTADATWEWTAEAIWKGGAGQSDDRQARCAVRVPSHRALDGKQTGFRCRTLPTRAVSTQPVGK